MASWWDDIKGFVDGQRDHKRVEDLLWNAPTLVEFDRIWNGLNETQRNYSMAQQAYNIRHPALLKNPDGAADIFTPFVRGALDEWLKVVAQYQTTDPTKAKDNLTALSAKVIEVSAAAASIDFIMGAFPNGLGEASSANTKQILAWLGFGAVLAAVAHDPVKIGLLRPYQDSLEQTFRNRRPDDNALFQAYRTRELSPAKVSDLSKLDDAMMNEIERQNDCIYNAEISRWGYSASYPNALLDACGLKGKISAEENTGFSGALARSATRTLSFADLRALANVGYFDRGLSIYSLWGYGLDRVTMKPALDGLQVMRDRQMYSGFRSLIEPSYIDGFLSEADLIAYWTKSGIPDDVQKWILPRMRARREAATLKAAGTTAQKERDLTVSQVQQAYQNLLMDRAKAQNMILALGYSLDEAKILLDLAELRRKLPAAQTLKRLTLTDFEKAYKNGLITREAVLERMKGEYAPGDIELERKLLEIGKA